MISVEKTDKGASFAVEGAVDNVVAELLYTVTMLTATSSNKELIPAILRDWLDSEEFKQSVEQATEWGLDRLYGGNR